MLLFFNPSGSSYYQSVNHNKSKRTDPTGNALSKARSTQPFITLEKMRK